jgi:CHAT domain-containing protein/lipopolysaccharide biosynthesis regulator YciM
MVEVILLKTPLVGTDEGLYPKLRWSKMPTVACLIVKTGFNGGTTDLKEDFSRSVACVMGFEMRRLVGPVRVFRLLAHVSVIATFLFLANASRSETDSTEDAMRLGQAAVEHGAIEKAVAFWQKAAQLYEARKDAEGEVEAWLALGNAYQAMGDQPAAIQVLERAAVLAEKSNDRRALALAKSSLGTAWSCSRQTDWAERNLREALAITRDLRDARTTSSVLNNLGNLQAQQGNVAEALAAFQEAITLAQQNTNHLLTAKAAGNAAAAAVRGERFAEAQQFNTLALSEIASLPPSHEQAFLWIRCGQTDWQMTRHGGEDASRLRARAEDSHQLALNVAERLGDQRAKTYALGYLGQIGESNHEYAKALELTRQAAFIAQQMSLPDALYRWEWQRGRLLRAQGNYEAAITAYRHAVQTVQPIRMDLALGSFREAAGAVYFELADLLLQRADSLRDPREVEVALEEARDTVEQLKFAELEDYLNDECAAVQLAKIASVERIGRNTAVIYIVPLPDRTELLVSLASGIKRFKLPVGAEQLAAEARELRLNLERRATNAYLLQARQMYEWLIRPIKGELTTNGVDTLVFVPDGALRLIPMAALQDGEHFLIEEFAVAVTPGLTLMEPKPTPRRNVRMLVGGMAQGMKDFPPLPNVAAELQTVAATFNAEKLLDHDFVTSKLKESFAQTQYQMVHFATHGKFESDAGKSFILTYDGKLTLNQLEDLIRPGQFRGKPVELLTLSACQTAAGDDRAALGLAGVAIKAGARSALASLWFVHDESTAMLMGEFYSRLRHEPEESKAKALQQAQLKLLNDARFGHPCYWAPFLIIGNWL